ncbi:MAG: hypothetical protein A3F89_01365 [Deltaproteobacteria bacterium RIFCSPLOWO2_12_FULL_50_11]|nr:MAG: hypothetical protein A3F89_01365 [Deltaproteobacteria bacterium RIFCSPLOWO2_12_FULL_50_11]
MDERFVRDHGVTILTGNECLVKGGLEGRMSLFTGYPGSPVATVFETVQVSSEIFIQKGIVAQIANNEALSASRLHGARMAKIRAMTVFKSVGMHVASDALALGNLAEYHLPEGGALVVVGDDPWMDSTQTNSDSRFLSQHLQIPVLQPATFQELKDWVKIGFELSGGSDLYITYHVTTNQVDGGGTVEVHPNDYPSLNALNPTILDSKKIKKNDLVVLPPRTWQCEASLKGRYQRLWDLARQKNLDQILYHDPSRGRAPLGFVTAGLPYCYLEHALTELGLSKKVPILKLGIIYPADPASLIPFLKSVENVVVVEEKRPFLENQVIELVRDLVQSGELSSSPGIWGKKFPFDLLGFSHERGLSPSLVIQQLIPLFQEYQKRNMINIDTKSIESVVKRFDEVDRLPPFPVFSRTPTFCSGCPHRDTSTVFLEIKRDFSDPHYMKRHHACGPLDLIFHGDTGCYSMLIFPPNESLMHNYAGMGLGGGSGAGIDPFITNKQVLFVGDGTFFNSGMLAISDSIKNNQDITYFILDNKTTAMTGHQPHAGNDVDIVGQRTFSQNIESILRAMGSMKVSIVRINPADRARYRKLIEETILKDGVKIIIADKECGITYHRKKKAQQKQTIAHQGFLPLEKKINIAEEVCENCLECTRLTGCPGLTIKETDYGPKIQTDLFNCVDDTACTKGMVCPSFEKVIIQRKRPQKNPLDGLILDDLPSPPKCDFKNEWAAYVAGVGGQGAGVTSAILVRAGTVQGYRIQFNDKKGLSIRSGGVYSHILFMKDDKKRSPIIPNGGADLILGLDLLETLRACEPRFRFKIAHPQRTRIMVNTIKAPTVSMLMGENDYDVDEAVRVLKSYSLELLTLPLGDVCQKYMGTKRYKNVALLGMAYQHGLIPLSFENIQTGIKQTVPPEVFEDNVKAFQLGRCLVVEQKAFLDPIVPPTYEQILKEKEALLNRKSQKLGQAYQAMIHKSGINLTLDRETNYHVALRVYDLIQYEGVSLAEHYLNWIVKIAAHDSKTRHYRITQAVLRNLYKVMAIKDEVWVAHLLTSPEKINRDRERYKIDVLRGDRLKYIHYNRPQFTLFGKDIRWTMPTKNWMLHVMKRLKFLRRLLPGWHAKEKVFRDWYVTMMEAYLADLPHRRVRYEDWLKILRLPEKVTGYREIRYPKQDQVMAEAEGIRKSL